MRVVVTGGSGQLGSLVMDEIATRYEAVSVDLRPPSSGHRSRHIRGDVRDLDLMRAACRGADAVVHLAAQVSVVRSTEDPVYDMDVNLGGTVNMLNAAVEEDVSLFLYVSTAAVYGDPVSLPVTEDHPTLPLSFYGASKLSAEHYVRTFKESRGLDHIIVRPFNMYSSRADPSSPYSGVITSFVENAKTGRPLVIDGDGEQTRDFIHARDVVSMIIMCLESDVRNVTMNCSSGRGTSINELAEVVASVFPGEVTVKNGPPRVGDIKHSVGDGSRAKELLGFVPATDLMRGMADFL